MNDLKFIVRTTETCGYDLTEMKKAIPGLVILVDHKNDAMDNFLNAMNYTDSPAVHLEDDIILCDDFFKKITTIITEHNEDVIQFYSMRQDDLTIGTRYLAGSSFCSNLCFYLPANIGKELFAFYKMSERRFEKGAPYDYMMADYFKMHKRRYLLIIPNLVDHIQGKSRIDSRRSSKRKSLTFVKSFIDIDLCIYGCHARMDMINQLSEKLSVLNSNIIINDRGPRGGGDAFYNFRRTWERPVGNYSHRLVLQDDVEVCNNFKMIVDKCVKKHPKSIFFFFGGPEIKFKHRHKDSAYVRLTGTALWGQAILMPVEYIAPLFWFVDNVYGGKDNIDNYEDHIVGDFAKTFHIEVLTTVPGLVQHLCSKDSMIGTSRSGRISHVYINSECAPMHMELFDGDSVYICSNKDEPIRIKNNGQDVRKRKKEISDYFSKNILSSETFGKFISL